MKLDISTLTAKEEALAQLFAAWTPELQTETVPLAEAAGRVLAEEVHAQYNIPLVRASAMDGVAFPFSLVENGVPDTTQWRLGTEFVRADTGDDFPDAYDTVVPIEQVKILPEGGLAFAPGIVFKRGAHVNPSGSQVQAGELLTPRGTVLNASDIAAIGRGGYASVRVVRRPRVAFVPTGSELVTVGTPIARGQNYDTNSVMAEILLREMGAEPVLRPILKDDPDALRQTLSELLEETDIVILNAGTSMGDEDYCGHLLEESGHLLFHGVAAVPGRPLGAAVIQNKPVLNISGPAIAALHGLEWMVRPTVARALGIPTPQRPSVQAVLTANVNADGISKFIRMEVTRGADGTYYTTPLAPHGPNAAPFGRLMSSNGYYMTIRVKPGESAPQAGDTIPVTLLRGLETIPEKTM
ncbi:MAG: molybdopterin molybdotransferase MoeA [Oscillospiraceae bacterium]|nr:molybdopterin molybdotransferase MoeA [Oscillospiraceae bacterium]